MTSIEIAAWLGSSILLKGSVIGVGVLIAARCARSAARASLVVGMGLGAWGIVLMLSPLIPAIGTGLVSVPHGAVQPVSIGSIALSIPGVIVALWGCGALFLLVRFVRDLRAARGVARGGGEAERRAGELLVRASFAIGVRRLPQLLETRELATAALIGFWRPVLLIPIQARDWSDEELFGVLCHELEHVRRNDWLMLMVERIIGAIFWINPLVYLMTRYSAGLREMAADDAALRAGTAAPVYAGRLIAVARALHNAPRLVGSIAFAEGGRVEERVKALFDRRDRGPSGRSSLVRATVVVLPMVLALAAFKPWSCLP